VRSVVTLRSQQGLQGNNVWEIVHYTKNSVLFLELRKSTNYCTAVSFWPIQTHGILNMTKSAKQHTCSYRDFEINVGAKHNNDKPTKIDSNARPSNTKQESIHYVTAAHGPVVKLLILITIACCSRGLTV
jgi:hypothetical protein